MQKSRNFDKILPFGGLLVFFVTVTALAFGVSMSALIDQGRNQIESLRQIRTYYAGVHESLQRNISSLDPVVSNANVGDLLPVPTTFMIGFAHASFDRKRVTTRVYSPYPMNAVADGALPGPFAEKAWRQLTEDGDDVIWTLGSGGDLLVAEADVFTDQSCVDCHNSHPSSRKRDWRLGDTRAVLEARVSTDRAASTSLAAGVIATILGAGFVFGFQSLQRYLAEREELSSIDPLTSVYNRRRFNEDMISLERSLPRDRRSHYVLMIDIDNFKLINDTQGHAVGDKVLVQTALAIEGALRADDRVYRWGGEEFLVWMVGPSSAEAVRACERLLRTIEMQEFSTSEKLAVTASIGLTPVDRNYPVKRAIERADALLYKAKSTGKNRVCHDLRLSGDELDVVEGRRRSK